LEAVEPGASFAQDRINRNLSSDSASEFYRKSSDMQLR